MAAGIGENVTFYVDFGGIRRRILGKKSQAPLSGELTAIKGLADKAMWEGSAELSGPFYAPQSVASVEDVIAVAGEAGKRGGPYETHRRDEGTSSIGVAASLREALRIVRKNGAPLHLDVWSQGLMVHYPQASGRMRYGPGTTRERHDDRGRPSSDTA